MEGYIKMAKRFADTNKYKKPFIRSLPGAYKLLWDFLYLDCDHAGIWIVDFDVAQMYIGQDMPVSRETALQLFNIDEVRVFEFDCKKKWLIVPFVEFQYGRLTEKNKALTSVISILRKYGLIDNNLNLKIPPASPLEGGKDKDKEMDKDKDGESKVVFSNIRNLIESEKAEEKFFIMIVLKMVDVFKRRFPKYPVTKDVDYPACLQIAYRIAELKHWKKYDVVNGKMDECLSSWESIVKFIESDDWLSTRSINDISGKEWQRLVQKMSKDKKKETPHPMLHGQNSKDSMKAIKESEGCMSKAMHSPKKKKKR